MSGWRVSSLIVATAALTVGTACGGDRFGPGRVTYLLAEDGRARFQIVIPSSPQPEEQEACELLRDTITSISGATAEIRSDADPAPDDLLQLHVGATRAADQADCVPADLDLDGFVIKPVGPRVLIIAGGRPSGTFYGVTEFLERYAGVLWVWPGEHGTVLPTAARLECVVREQVSEPAFLARRFSGMKGAKMAFYRIHQTKREVRSEFHHNVWKVLKPDLYWDQHPEYFAEIAGKRAKPERLRQNWQACTSDPGVVRVFVDAAKQQFTTYPWITSFSVSQNDGGGFCTCIRCKALDIPGEEGISDRYFTFQNAVADGVATEFPGKLVCCFAYGAATRDVPKRVSLRPNTMIYAVIPTLGDVHQDVLAWSKVAPKLGVYFWMHGKAVPKYYPRRLARYLQFLLDHNVREAYAEVYQRNLKRFATWELDGPRVWMIAKLLWDPYADVDDLIQRFCTRFYGRGAEPMLRYFKRCEQAWERRASPDDFGSAWRSLELDTYTAEDMDFMLARIEEALALTTVSEAETYRLEALQRELRKPALASRQFDAGRALAAIDIRDRRSAERALAQIDGLHSDFMRNVAWGSSLFGPPPQAYEEAVDDTCERISRTLDASALPFWRLALVRHPACASYIRTQINVLGKELPNICPNPGFEQQGQEAGEEDTALNWRTFDAPGWSNWIRPGTPGKIVLDRSETRDGDVSVRIEGCKSACVLQRHAVHPGERYQVKCWARRREVADILGGGMTASLKLKWMNGAGKWLEHIPTVAVPLPEGAAGWAALSTTVTIAPGVGTLVVMLSATDQSPTAKLWFDDVSVHRVLTVPDSK